MEVALQYFKQLNLCDVISDLWNTNTSICNDETNKKITILYIDINTAACSQRTLLAAVLQQT